MIAKRAMGQCSETCHAYMASPERVGMNGHSADCPALYPLQPQPGEQKDALTRLVVHIRLRDPDCVDFEALDLISEAREEHKTVIVERDGADERARMLLDAKNAIVGVFEQKVAGLEHDLAKTMDTLLATQKRMGEGRQTNLDEGREQGHMDAFLWLRAHHKGILAPTAEDMRVDLAQMMGTEPL